MIRIFEFDALKPEEILNRDIRAEASVEATVDAIIADVRARGDAALKDYALKFDHAQLDELRVSQAEIDEAFEAAGFAMLSAEPTMVPQTMNPVDVETGRKIVRLLEALEDNEDVQNVHSNADLPDELMAEMA